MVLILIRLTPALPAEGVLQVDTDLTLRESPAVKVFTLSVDRFCLNLFAVVVIVYL
jgi:hypothetical protein